MFLLTGIHYVGQLDTPSISRTLVDQISDGQIQWTPLDENFDTVRKRYNMRGSYL